MKEVVSTRCLGIQTDNAAKWDHHVLELTRLFTQKMILVKSLYFLPRRARTAFYFRVILPLLHVEGWFGALALKGFS